MTKARLLGVLCALLALSGVVVGCGGVPGNAVATVDGEPISKAQFDHWFTIAAKASGQATATVPDPPDYKACIAAKRKAAAKPTKGQPKQTDGQLKTQCQQEYEAGRDHVLQLLIPGRWTEGEAETMGIEVSDREVRKPFETQKKQADPKDAD